MNSLIIILFLTLLVMPISLAYASSDDQSVNLGDFPAKLADALNVSLAVGQLLASLIFMSLFLFPSMLIAGYFGGSGAVLYAIIFVGLGSSAVCAFLGWLPSWLFIMMAVIAGLLLAGNARDWMTGKGRY
jgi:hypothetical protein